MCLIMKCRCQLRKYPPVEMLMRATLKVNEMLLLLWLQSAIIKPHRRYGNLMAHRLSILGASGTEEVM